MRVRGRRISCAAWALACLAGHAVARGQAVEPPLQLADRGPVFFAVPTPGAAPVDARDAVPMRRRVSLELIEVPLPAALRAITQQCGVRFVYEPELVPATARVTLEAQNIRVSAALTELLSDVALDVKITSDNQVTLVHHDGPTLASVRRRQQGGGAIDGRVTDGVTGAPLDQVAVRVEGPGVGAVSTSDGHYTVRNVSSGTYRLTARRVGYTPFTKTVTVVNDSTTTADFALAAAPTRLNEMVTTAVGDQRRYEVGNTIATVNADSIAPTAPLTNLTDLISARAPGVEVEETSGLTGSGEAVRIRGQSSLVLQGDPIVIVDGVRQDNAAGGTAVLPMVRFTGAAVPSPSRLNDLDFNDIQLIDVLKGPAASTEYGTDAANGVIVITTKHGTAGRPQWTTSAEADATEIPVSFPRLYYSWGHTTDATHTPVNCPLVPYFVSGGYGSTVHTCAVDSVTAWDPLNNSYYSIFGTGRREKYDLSLSGGSEAVRYFVSGGLSNETGVVQMPGAFVSQADALGLPHSMFRPNGEDQRSIRATTAIRLGPTADLTVTGTYLSAYQASPNAQALYSGVVYTRALRDSAIGYGYAGYGPYYTPVYQLGNPTSQTTSRLTGGFAAGWRPTSWLMGHGVIGVDHGSQRDAQSVLPQVAPLDPYIPAQLGVENGTTDIYTMDLRASATAALTQSVRSVASIGLQLADKRIQAITATATGITATNFTLNGVANPSVTQLGNRQATLGGYGEEQLAITDRLFLTGAVRIDAGSGFGRAYSTTLYPKASLSWLALSSRSTALRLRAALGESGVQPPNGAALALYAPTTALQSGAPTSVLLIGNVPNPRLRPERSGEYESGVDVGLWQNRVSIELTGYKKTTRDALVSVGSGWDAGSLPYTENVGTVRNVGAEGSLTAAVIRGRVLTWDVTLNGSVNHNKLVTLAPGALPQQMTGWNVLEEFASGYPLYGYWAPRVGYADLNHDGVIEPGEVTLAKSTSYIGPTLPTREASLGTHIAVWGGAVAVGALVDYRGGFRLANTDTYDEAQQAPQSDRASNQRAAPLWQQARDVAAELTLSSICCEAPAGFYEDGTYIRVRELSLTYAVPRRITRVLHVNQLSLTGAVRNLALWTRYTGTDPEVTNSSGNNAQLSPTSNTYTVNNDIREGFAAVPLLRYWVARINVGL